MTYWLVAAVVAVLVSVGFIPLLYGRSRLVRSVGVLVSSVLGPAVAWWAGGFLFTTVGVQLWGRPPSVGDVHVLGRDITLGQLLWLPLKNAWFLLLVIAGIFLLPLITSKQTPYTTHQEFYLRFSRFLDRNRQGAGLGRQVYKAVTIVTVALVLPVTGLIAYATLRLLLAGGETVAVSSWLQWSVLGGCVLFELLYLFVNGAVALRD